MKWRLLLPVLALALLPQAAAAKVRALFVGIDDYRFSSDKGFANDFKSLRGAVNDVGQVKAAFERAYRLGLDVPAAGCESANAVSITLTNQCATRAAILAAFDDRLRASAPGDTLLFFFAGHGAQFVDSGFDQASGMHDTILPHDAREPGAAASADILDRDFRLLIDAASARGVNVITIFDSCNSGTATRDFAAEGESRAAPMLVIGDAGGGRGPAFRAARAADPPQPPPTAGPARPGYRVHLAAAADGQVAREVPARAGAAAAPRSGVFSTALAQAVVAMPGATFSDIFEETRRLVYERGANGQDPQAEGSLTARLGGGEARVPLFEARSSGAGVTLGGGQLSGVSEGSVYALFASTTDAVSDGGRPLGSGTVTAVGPSTAELRVDGAAGPLPPRLVARETARAFGSLVINLRIDLPGAEAGQARAAVADLPYVAVREPAELILKPGALVDIGGNNAGTQLAANDPGYAAKLREDLARVAKVRALLALRTRPSEADAALCLDNRPFPADLAAYDPFGCEMPAPPAAGAGALTSLPSSVIQLRAGVNSGLVVRNMGEAPRFLYVLGINPQYGVTLLVPFAGGKDPAVAPGRPVARPIQPLTPGRYRFVTLATDAPVNAAAFEQEGARDPGACVSAIEQALCAANAGLRGADIPRVGNWTATVTEADVK